MERVDPAGREQETVHALSGTSSKGCSVVIATHNDKVCDNCDTAFFVDTGRLDAHLHLAFSMKMSVPSAPVTAR